MSLRTFAEIVALIVVVVAVLHYSEVEPNVLDKIPERYRTVAEKDIEAMDIKPLDQTYADKNSALYCQYKAAVTMPSLSDKSEVLSKVIKAALEIKDFEIAIAAAKEISGSISKTAELQNIVSAALATEGAVGFSVIAAELMTDETSKASALNEIVKFYDKKSQEPLPVKELSSLEQYNLIYQFADSSAHMGLYTEDAKKFAEDWIKNRDYQSFILFKEYFSFANSPRYFNMSSEDAVIFSYDWLDNSTTEDFEIYKKTLIVSDSPSGMNILVVQ